jgi:iron complex transport system ATP-binding protein
VSKDISISIPEGEIVCLIGPNGAGKSTLIRTIAGIQPPLDGQVMLLGTEIHALRPQELAKLLSVVLTERVNVGTMSAYSLVALGRYPYTDLFGTLTPKDERIIQWAIESVGASDLASRHVSELSDGERQKVMIARALAQEPTLIILDEPTAFLDMPRRVEIMRILRTLAHTTGKSILLSTHDLELALRSADRMWLMSARGDLQIGAPEDLVLSGAFEEAFHSEGIEFDGHTGSFKIHTLSAGEIILVGNGAQAFWTKRALERAGYSAIQKEGKQADPSLKKVEIISHNNHKIWRLTSHNDIHECPSLYELVSLLRKDQDKSKFP